MKRFSLLMLSFLIVAVFDWLFVSALLANGAEVAPDSQAVEIPAPMIQPASIPTVSASQESSSQVMEIPLPQSFGGCWRGDVRRVDSQRSNHWFLPNFMIKWWPKPYTLCFTRVGLDSWNIFYGKSKLDRQTGLWIRVVQSAPSTVESASVTLEGTAHITIRSTYAARGRAFKVETAALECRPDTGSTLHVVADVQSASLSGYPEPSGTWHKDFQSVVVGGDTHGNGNGVDGAPAR